MRNISVGKRMGFPVWCVDRLLSPLRLSAWCPRLPSGVEKGDVFFPAASEHVAAVSGLCPRVGGFSLSSCFPGRASKDLGTGRRGPLLEGSFLCWPSSLLPWREGGTRLPSGFLLNASLGWCKRSAFTSVTILRALLGIARVLSISVNRREVFSKSTSTAGPVKRRLEGLSSLPVEAG